MKIFSFVLVAFCFLSLAWVIFLFGIPALGALMEEETSIDTLVPLIFLAISCLFYSGVAAGIIGFSIRRVTYFGIVFETPVMLILTFNAWLGILIARVSENPILLDLEARIREEPTRAIEDLVKVGAENVYWIDATIFIVPVGAFILIKTMLISRRNRGLL